MWGHGRLPGGGGTPEGPEGGAGCDGGVEEREGHLAEERWLEQDCM